VAPPGTHTRTRAHSTRVDGCQRSHPIPPPACRTRVSLWRARPASTSTRSEWTAQTPTPTPPLSEDPSTGPNTNPPTNHSTNKISTTAPTHINF
jgi:hypothetical protein